MASISIPLDAITSRLNLGDRFSGLRSQSFAARFANLKPVSEFFDLKRLSKPNNFGEVQTRVNYNLSYFSSNYAVVFVMLTVYSLISNPLFLFDIIFVAFGMWFIGKMKGQDLEIGTFKATTAQLYTGLLCISVPLAFFSGPFRILIWLIGASAVTILGGGLGGRPRAPYDVPLSGWGRPPGARLGRGQRERAWAAQQSWPEYDDRFEEIDSEDDALRGVDLHNGYAPKRFASDELRFTGIDLGGGRPIRRQRSGDPYDDDEYTPSEDDYDGSAGLVRRGNTQLMLREKEHVLLDTALERIRRAQALGKRDAKLSPAEVDILERFGYLPRPPPQPTRPPAPAAAPKSKKPAAKPKQKAIEAKKTAAKKDTSSSSSPKRKTVELARSRGRSTASNRSRSDTKEDAMVPYPVLPEERGYSPAYYARQSAPVSRQNSRETSTQALRGQPPHQRPPYQQPYYYPPRYYSNPDMYDDRPPSNGSRASRPDPADPDWEPRTRSTSALISYPIDQLPTQGQGRAPRFDPADPRFGSPPTSRRVVSGPPVSQYRRPQDELFMPVGDQPEVMQYLASSSGNSDDDEEEEDDTDESGQGVSVDVAEKPGGGYAIQTRAQAATSTNKGKGAATGKKKR